MRRSLLLLLALLLVASDAIAGGPLGAVGTTPRRYAASAFPLAYRTDLGPLGSFSNATAVAISVYSFQQWDNVGTAALSFTNAGALARDVTSATDPYISGSTQFNDRINPVVFDTDGSITDAKLGVGARNSVLGFAGSAYSGGTYVEGYAIINGALSGSGGTADQDKYRATMTHEIGHFLGLGHSQIAMHADFATMYPIVIKATQQTLDPDDISAISVLYPATNYLAGVGSISGTVKRPAGTNLSGVNVVAVNTSTGDAYSGVVDYFSGGKSGFDSPPAATGSYTISGLPPGSYYVRIEPVNANFTGGSSIASYNTPVNTTVAREWYNAAGESGDMLADNTNQQSAVAVTAGGSSGGINVIANESATLTTLAYHDGTPAVAFPIPLGSVTQYATRFTAPANGSLTSIKFLLQGNSNLPLSGNLIVTVHANASGSIGGVPGTVLGSVTIPFRDLVADQHNEVWLRGLGSAVNFTAGTSFHVSFSTNNVGTPTFLTDDGNPTQNRSSYLIPANGWKNFGEGGYNVGYNLIVWALYSSSSSGGVPPPTPQIAMNPVSLDYGRVRPGTGVSKTTVLTNTGTAALNVTGVALLGQDSLDFRIVAGGGAFSLAPGASRTLNIRFQPLTSGGTEDGSKSAQLAITSNAERSPFSIPLLGNAVQPLAARFDTAIAFANTLVGETGFSDTVVLTNTCNDTLNIRSMTLSGADGGGAITLAAPFEAVGVAPKGGYRVKLRFLPTEQRMYNAVLRIEHDDSVGFTEFAVSGRGVAPVMAVSADSLDAGAVKVGAEGMLAPLSIRNTGDAPLAITDLRVAGGGAPEFTVVSPVIAPGTPVTVAPGGSLDVLLRFRPVSFGERSAALEIVAAGNPPVRVPLNGVGLQGMLVLGSTSADFGDVAVGGTGEKQLDLANNGNHPVVISSVAAAGAAFTIADAPPAGTSIAPGDTLSLRMRFLPVSEGNQAGTVTVISDGMVPVLVATLAGRGVQAGLAADRTAITFGRVRLGESAADSLVLRNTGTAPLLISGVRMIGVHADAFEVVAPATSFTIPPGEGRIVGVRLRAQSQEGELQARLAVDADGGLGTELPVSAVVGPRMKASAAVVDFGTYATSGSRDTVILLRNLVPANVTITEAGLDSRKEGIPGDYFRLVDRSVPFVIPGGDSALLGVRFQPDGAGLYMAALTLRTDDPADSTITVLFYGAVSQQVGSVSAGSISAGGLSISGLLVAPNPVRNRAEILFSVGGTGRLPVTVTLADSRGSAIATLYEGIVQGVGTLHDLTLPVDLGGYSSGEYYVMLSGGGRTMTAKMVVVR